MDNGEGDDDAEEAGGKGVAVGCVANESVWVGKPTQHPFPAAGSERLGWVDSTTAVGGFK